MDKLILLLLAAANLAAFALFGADKQKARAGGWRISERALFTSALLGGGFGAWCGMYFFRHKTKHISFMLLIPLITLAEYGFLAWLLFG